MRRKGMPMKKQEKVSEKDFDEELSVSESRMNRKAARKKRILRNRLLFLGVILLIVGAILFRFLVVARTVNVTNETPYSDEQLLASMKEGEGSFLFSFSFSSATVFFMHSARTERFSSVTRFAFASSFSNYSF